MGQELKHEVKKEFLLLPPLFPFFKDERNAAVLYADGNGKEEVWRRVLEYRREGLWRRWRGGLQEQEGPLKETRGAELRVQAGWWGKWEGEWG